MADPVVQTDLLHAGHSDIRAEAINHTNEIVREGIKSEAAIRSDIKDTLHATTVASDLVGDRLIDQLDKQYHRSESRDYVVARDLAEMRGNNNANYTAVMAAIAATSKDSEINSLKTSLEMQKSQTAIMEKIGYDGNETRKLINDLTDANLNRLLIERNTDLSECRNNVSHWRGRYDQSQYAGLSNQLQAFQSQLQETRQGMTNFGTMSGVGQSTTSNIA